MMNVGAQTSGVRRWDLIIDHQNYFNIIIVVVVLNLRLDDFNKYCEYAFAYHLIRCCRFSASL